MIEQNEKTKLFIEKAIVKHGDKYDYSKVEYIKAREKIIIICKKHGEFIQRPDCHLSTKRGCKVCSMIAYANSKKMTTEIFIKKAMEIHGDKYDYSKVEYIKSEENIIIICKEHCDYLQQPNNHLQGKGCKKCGIKNTKLKLRSNTKEFIEKSMIIHGDKYDYSNVEYIDNSTNIIIICFIHGMFEQKPAEHLSGCGCRKCACNNYSKSSIKYLNFMEKMYNIQIQHAENVGEHIIKTTNYSADGFCEKTNTIYEFHGDFWHGNPNLYDTNDINKRNGKTFGELYQKTLEREQLIKELGYNLVIIWENDWNKLNKSIRTLQQKFKQHH